MHKYPSQAILQPKFVLEVLSKHPLQALAYFLSNTMEWMEPLAALLRSSDRYAAYLWMHLGSSSSSAAAAGGTGNSSAAAAAAEVLEAELQDFMSQHRDSIKHFMPFAQPVVAVLQPPPVAEGSDVAQTRRKLLQEETWKDNLADSNQQLQNDTLLSELEHLVNSKTTAAASPTEQQQQALDWFLQGPIEWPPIATARIQRDGGCLAGRVVADVLVQSFKAMRDVNNVTRQPPLSQKRQRIWNITLMRTKLHRFEGDLPKGLLTGDVQIGDSFVKMVLVAIKDTVSRLLDIRDIMGFIMGPEEETVSGATLAKQVCSFGVHHLSLSLLTHLARPLDTGQEHPGM